MSSMSVEFFRRLLPGYFCRGTFAGIEGSLESREAKERWKASPGDDQDGRLVAVALLRTQPIFCDPQEAA
jgi:hypothetical protein